MCDSHKHPNLKAFLEALSNDSTCLYSYEVEA